VVIDGRMNKRPPKLGLQQASLVIGLGPGFEAGVNSHAVVETKRGHRLGRVIWKGLPEADTGVPESVDKHGNDRVLRAPADGILVARKEICDRIEEGEVVAEVAGLPIQASFTGILRGMLHTGLPVTQGMKVGDIDPRDDPSFCTLVSDKALAIGGGVLEAIFSRPDLRPLLWT
jgi:xanthine dehydrogenase accessory factor